MSASEHKRLLQTAEACFRSGNLAKARAVLESLVATQTRLPRAFELLGYLHGNEGRLDEALRCLERACELPGTSPEAHYYLGVALLRQGRAEPAVAAFDRSIALAGPFFEALHDRGTALSRLGRHLQALDSYRHAARWRPDSFELTFNLAKVLDELQDFDGALQHYDRALAVKPDSADVLAHRGALLYDTGRYADAIASWERALALDPGIEHLRGYLLHARLRLCDWGHWSSERAELLDRMRRGEDVCGPFELLAISDDPVMQAIAAKGWAKCGDSPPPEPPPSSRQDSERLRVGYFSADFGRHAVSHLMAEVFDRHDRRTVETFGVALKRTGPGDETRVQLSRSFDHFIDAAEWSDAEIVRHSRELGLDIAVDLGGHTRGARTAIFRARVAPVQVNFLGYPGTMGAPFMDYVIADETTIPGPSREHYTERTVWMPDCFQPADTRLQVTPPAASRHAWGLPENGFVFCCFNNTYKINPEVFASWTRILQAVEGACLWLLADHETVQTRLRQEAGRAGLDPNRIVFAGRLQMAEYLGRYRLADLFLDTLPFNAGTTARDALFAGLPLLTCPGQAFAGRMAASLLRALDLPELVAPSRAAYEALAVRLAQSPDEMRSLRERLGQAARQGPLRDMAAYTRALEGAYKEMCRRQRAGLPPDHLQVARA
jgi:predicted O-linked N-acetylglucosamine transferase (SPINDLY family)